MRNGLRKLIVRACRLGRDERGFAVPTVMFMLLAVFAVVSVGVMASIQAQNGSVRDQNTKSAFTVAEAGVSQALLRYNGDLAPSSSSPCLIPDPSTGAVGSQPPDGSGWCAPVAGSNGTGTYNYWVKPTPSTGTLEIVSSGTFNGVLQRVDVVAKSVSGQQLFSDAAVKTQNGITVDQNSAIYSGSATGGDIVLNGTAKQCGIAKVGVGHHMTPSGTNGYYTDTTCTTHADASTVTQENMTLPPVNQGDAATLNDNWRIAAALQTPPGTGADLISGKQSNVTWNATTRQLSIKAGAGGVGGTSLTLTGHAYSFCKVTLNSNTALYVASGQTVNIYFDSPNTCDQPVGTLPVDDSRHPELGTTQMQLDSNSRITSAAGTPASVAVYFVGSSTRPTNAVLSSNTGLNTPQTCVQNFVVYGPLTDFSMASNSTYCGALAGRSLHVNSNAYVNTDSASQSFTLPLTAPHYMSSKFVECTAVQASPPNTGC